MRSLGNDATLTQSGNSEGLVDSRLSLETIWMKDPMYHPLRAARRPWRRAPSVIATAISIRLLQARGT